MSDKEVKSLICKRSKIKSALTRANTYYNNLNLANSNESTFNKIKTRLNEILPLLDNFNEIMDKIEELDEDNMESHNNERENFELNYQETISKYETYLEDTEPASSDRSSSHEIISRPLNVKLPVLTLPNFSGEYHQWTSFSETFKSLIHNNEAIDDIQRFHYLKSCLSGEAANTISSLTVTSSNYQTAWDLLTKRFENKRLIVDKLFQSIWDLQIDNKNIHASLRQLLDCVQANIRALKNIVPAEEMWDITMCSIIKNKFDFKIRSEFESQNKTNELVSLDSLYDFIKNKCDLLDTLRPNNSQNSNKYNILKTNRASHLAYNKNTKLICFLCKESHLIYSCPKFKQLSVNERLEKTRELNLCTNCLNKGHSNKNCKSTYMCKTCQKRHHSLLHVSNNPVNSKLSDVTPSTSNHSACRNIHTLLSTACVNLVDKYNRNHNCRVLLDSGSQSNFITKKMCRKLGVDEENANILITGINQGVSRINKKTQIKFKSNNSLFESNLTCLISEKITEMLPQFAFNAAYLNIPKNIKLADPSFNEPGDIDMLIGSDLFYNLLCVGQITLGKNMPTLQKTKLGWVIAGPIPINFNQCNSISNISLRKNSNVEFPLSKFWELEEVAVTIPYTRDEKYCENNFIKTTKRDHDGRFIVTMPLKDNAPELGTSRNNALKRFYSLERKLSKNNELRELYINFMNEYEQLGHMRKINPHDMQPSLTFYLPHHPVIKIDSSTTKLRVVFDGSAQSDSKLSLNSVQMVGPTIQRDLFSILLRFRRFKYALTADIAKMYRQVLIAPENRPLQRILWRKSPDEDINEFELQTVTYGTASASFLAIRCIKQLALDNKLLFPHASSVIENDFYVDDLLTGGNSISEVNQLRTEIINILSSGGFTLRKWLSNNKSVLPNVNNDSASSLIISDSLEIKTLGLLWDSISDSFKYKNKIKSAPRITKRTILSFIGQLFDPLGFLAPVIIKAKLIMQLLWQLKINWDESLPQDIHSKWNNFIHNLRSLEEIKINRRIMCDDYNHIELHGFCDASLSAYGACVYVKTINSNGKTQITLLCAKSKVAPLKQLTIPRLELCGALLLAQLINKIRNCLDINFNNEYYWCDSTIVLHWIKSESNKWKTFVANRVAQIQESTHITQWLYVNTSENPADLITRGVDSDNLINNKLWWCGPSYLNFNSSNWPLTPFTDHSIQGFECEERKIIATTATTINKYSDFITISNYSNFNKLLRVTSYCLRFISRIKNKQTGPLTTNDLKKAHILLIKLCQAEHFSEDIKQLNNNKALNKKSPILALNPFLDTDGILRVGGRLSNSNYSFEKRHPIILHNKHHLTIIIAETEHRNQMHCGPQTLLATLRNKYWPLSGRNLCKKIVRKCIICFKLNASSQPKLMGDLPVHRLTATGPFHTCGIDYAGPFLIKNKAGRGAKINKAYLCIFVCFATKAMHLELVSDLTTAAFIAALRRFCGRRGKPLNIYSDNGKNFIGARNELNELAKFLLKTKSQNEIIQNSSDLAINWHFIPPRSPHFGGLWEAGVKSVKSILRRIIGNASLTYEELNTYLIQAEGILNSRPLTPLSSDPNDLIPLTPAHFLIGRSLIGPPDADVTEVSETRLTRFQRIQKLVQHFWTRWTREYLSELQQRSKWKQNSKNLHVGDLVLLKDESTISFRWILGRVQDVHPGADGVVRVVTVKTTSGVLKRSVMKLCLLPIDS